MTRQEALRTLDEYSKRLVHRAANCEGPLAEALFTVAMRGQTNWGYAEWKNRLAELDSCDLPIAEWVELETLIA